MRKRWDGWSTPRRVFVLANLAVILFGIVCIVLIATDAVPHASWLFIPDVLFLLGTFIANPIVLRHDQNRQLDEIAARVAAEDAEQEAHD